MKILLAVLVMSLSLGFMMMGLQIFSKLHCRQDSWHHHFKDLTNIAIHYSSPTGGTCKTRYLYPLKMRLGKL